jgi:KUP system potassium uptake protein
MSAEPAQSGKPDSSNSHAPQTGGDKSSAAATSTGQDAEPPNRRSTDDTIAPPSPALGTTGARPVPPHRHHPEQNPTGRKLAVLSLTALGVVYGDIGTSPLYSIKECFKAEYGLVVNQANVYGVLSLIVWSLVLIVSVKYVFFILRADNRGEGGVLALLALVLQRHHRAHEARRRAILIALGLFGGAFLYGDGMITPAISVLGAVEGLKVAAPAFEHFVIPLSFGIIAALFYFQYKGTAAVGGLFGWIMLIWFVTIGVLGIMEIAGHWQILKVLNPWYAVRFFLDHPTRSFVVLGAVVLVITGGEALYADMGHFGRKPIRLVWFALVLPALLLNYFGQGALLLRNPEAVANPFYLLAPSWFIYPLLFIATSAAIVASQALISGAFSLTQQAVQLGYTPRVTIVHTSHEQAGQIYIPEVNKALAVGTLLLVVMFGSSEALGAAYGPAVTGTMAITTVLFYVIAIERFNWPKPLAVAFLAFFLAIDLAFFFANLLKVPHGGWVPLVVASMVFVLMTTWKRGREILRELMRRASMPLDQFLSSFSHSPPVRVKGTAVFMTSDPEGVPVVLLHHLKHNKALHEQVILLSVQTAEVPEVSEDEWIQVEKLAEGFNRVRAIYGFMETPDVKEILARCTAAGIRTKPMDTSYFLGRERLIPVKKRSEAPVVEGRRLTMSRWRKKLFIFMTRNARSATEFFGIPPNRVVELGAQIEF